MEELFDHWSQWRWTVCSGAIGFVSQVEARRISCHTCNTMQSRSSQHRCRCIWHGWIRRNDAIESKIDDDVISAGIEVIAGSFWSAFVGEHPAIHPAQYIATHLFGEETIENGLRQSAAPAVLEAKVLFREGYYFEQSLRKNWTAINEPKLLPRATVFQGHLDVNVPRAHSRFVHENIFGGGNGARLVEFDDMGHLSLVIKKADEVLQSVARG